jgi:formate-dependent nitrite reductase membrane component NrfD
MLAIVTSALVEFSSTAKGPLVEPHLSVWGWEIPVYLFLGGFTAGILVLAGWTLLRAGGERPARFGSASAGQFGVGLVAISLGMLALFLDLAHRPYVLRLYLTFEPRSPMSWGAWILLLVYPVLLAGLLQGAPAWLLARVPGARGLATQLAAPRARAAVGVAALVSGVALGTYTGILLSALSARPFWSSALLGPLFLVSGLSAAAAFGHLTTPRRDERERLARLDALLLLSELGLLGLFVLGLATATRAHAEAAVLVLGGPLTAVFWVGVVGLGIVLPLLIQSLAVTHRVAHTPLAPLLVLAGGLALRFAVVHAGQLSRWPRP